jgi:hypothetical protein
VLIDSQCPKELFSELSALAEEVKNELQIVACLLPQAPVWAEDQLSSIGAEVHLARTFHEALVLISDNAAGNYIALSDGESIPYASFIRYLKESFSMSPAEPQLLHGYTYCKDRRTGIIRDAPGAPALEDAEIESYCLDNLSFVVRRQEFQAVIRQRFDDFSSMCSLFSDLWQQCSRKRVYRITNLLLSRTMEMYGPSSSRILRKMERRFQAYTVTGRILRFLFAERIVILYKRLPLTFRMVLHKAVFRVLLGKQ